MTTITKECVLVASIFDNPTGRFGENLCTALAHWEWWESVEAKLVAEGIKKCLDKGKVPSRSMVAAHLENYHREWLTHPMFGSTNALSLELADHEAAGLLPIYRNKRLIAVVGNTYSKMLNWPHDSPKLIDELKRELENV